MDGGRSAVPEQWKETYSQLLSSTQVCSPMLCPLFVVLFVFTDGTYIRLRDRVAAGDQTMKEISFLYPWTIGLLDHGSSSCDRCLCVNDLADLSFFTFQTQQEQETGDEEDEPGELTESGKRMHDGSNATNSECDKQHNY